MASRGRFITPKTAGFIKHITDEFMTQMGQSVIIYQLKADVTDPKSKYSIYRESSSKQYLNGVQIKAIVEVTEKNTENLQDVGYELRNEAIIHFHYHDLKELDIFPTIGDIISFQENFYEIYDTNDADMLHGSPEYKYMFSVNCHDIRISEYDVPLDNDLQVNTNVQG